MDRSWIDDPAEVSLPEWEAVLARSFRPTPFLSPEYLLPWADRFARNGSRRVYRWAPGGKAEGFLFLHRLPGDGGWELLGGEELSDSLDAVVAAGSEPAFWETFLEECPRLLSDGGELRLPSLVEGTPTLSLLPGLCDRRGLACRVEETDRSPFLSLPGGFEEYLGRLGKKERHELRRKMRRAVESVPDLSYRVTDAAGLARDLDSFLSLHRASREGKERFMDDRMERFFREIAGRFLARGNLRLSFLSAGGTDVASAFQLEWNGSLLLYNSGFDPAYRKLSPGLVLLARCIEEAIGRGIREYDFLRGRERYKYDLGGTDRTVYRAVVGTR
ncbi:MAG: GNAT family N-acetyltransferase [Deltaproteobacteria bacterium]